MVKPVVIAPLERAVHIAVSGSMEVVSIQPPAGDRLPETDLLVRAEAPAVLGLVSPAERGVELDPPVDHLEQVPQTDQVACLKEELAGNDGPVVRHVRCEQVDHHGAIVGVVGTVGPGVELDGSGEEHLSRDEVSLVHGVHREHNPDLWLLLQHLTHDTRLVSLEGA